MGAEVVENDVKLALWIERHDAVHEGKEFDPAAALGVFRNHLPGGHI